MMGRQRGDQSQLFYLFNLEQRIPATHLLRRINPVVTGVLADLRDQLAPFYSDIGRPPIDPELMIRMLIVGYCYGIRSERRLCEEVDLHLAYRWFCRLDLDEPVPDHSTFSVTFSRSDFRWDKRRDVYICPNNKVLHTTGTVYDGTLRRYRASKFDCDVCPLKMKCCPNAPARHVPRDLHEKAPKLFPTAHN